VDVHWQKFVRRHIQRNAFEGQLINIGIRNNYANVLYLFFKNQ